MTDAAQTVVCGPASSRNVIRSTTRTRPQLPTYVGVVDALNQAVGICQNEFLQERSSQHE